MPGVTDGFGIALTAYTNQPHIHLRDACASAGPPPCPRYGSEPDMHPPCRALPFILGARPARA